jgi:ribonuclease HIII
LKGLLDARGFSFREVPHAVFAAEGPQVQLVMYRSGKLVVQGKGAQDFVQFTLEPEVLGLAELGYEAVLNPELAVPRLGVDESGKGDLFGPLCVAGVYFNEGMLESWGEAGIRDSKQVASDRRIGQLAEVIRKTPGCVWNVVPIGNAAYNRLHRKLGSVNRILAWGHARVIENLLGQRHRMNPLPVRAVVDKFATREETVSKALMTDGRGLELVQRHRAESDMVVAAASILARDEFVRRLDRLGQQEGLELPKGAGEAANVALRMWLERHGRERLGEIAKLHFRNTLSV